MGIPISGATREAYDKTKVESSSSKPFPYLTGKWTNHTAQVALVELALDENGNGNDQLVIRARNGEHESRIYISLDPNRVGLNCKDIPEQVQKNIDRLLKVGKALEIVTWKGNTPEIEPGLFKQAVGKIIEIGVQGAADAYGAPKNNQRGYQIINTSFGGISKELRPVVAPAGAQAPVTATAGDGYGDSDIPF